MPISRHKGRDSSLVQKQEKKKCNLPNIHLHYLQSFSKRILVNLDLSVAVLKETINRLLESVTEAFTKQNLQNGKIKVFFSF